jgi:CubicO group peptidase (beta-lactamase class C family)
MRYLILGLVLAAPLQAQTVPAFSDPGRAEKVAATAATVDQKFREYAERQHMPGFAYGVVLDGELLFSQIWNRWLRRRRTPCSALPR